MNSSFHGCLQITASNVKLNMNRQAIIGNNHGVGIFVDSGATGVKISNPDDVSGPHIYNFDYGIYVKKAPFCTLNTVGATQNNYYGILIDNSSHPYVYSSTAVTTDSYNGITFVGCYMPKCIGGYTYGNGHSGIWFDGCYSSRNEYSYSSANTYYGHVQTNTTSNFYTNTCWAEGNDYDGFAANDADGYWFDCESNNSTYSCGFSAGNGSSIPDPNITGCTGTGNPGGLYCPW
jgi:hypothetical protein